MVFYFEEWITIYFLLFHISGLYRGNTYQNPLICICNADENICTPASADKFTMHLRIHISLQQFSICGPPIACTLYAFSNACSVWQITNPPVISFQSSNPKDRCGKAFILE